MKRYFFFALILSFAFLNVRCTSALITASRDGNENEVKMLLDKGADIKDRDKHGATALSWASKNGHVNVVKVLLDKGANPDEGIHGGVYSGNTKLIQMLLDKGADINLNTGKINLSYIREVYYSYVVAEEMRSLTPLAFLAYNKYNDNMAKYLISKGANIEDALAGLKQAESGSGAESDQFIKNLKNAIAFLDTLKSTSQSRISFKEHVSNKTYKYYSGTKEMIAVMDFTTKDVAMPVAYNVSELIRTGLINTGKYTIIERSQMKEILKEQGFQQTGCTDTSCAVQVGKLLSARKILIGSVMKLGSKLIISGRIVDVEKGVGEQGATGKAKSIDDLDEGVTDFINNLSGL
jgi:hypothetical protein